MRSRDRGPDPQPVQGLELLPGRKPRRDELLQVRDATRAEEALVEVVHHVRDVDVVVRIYEDRRAFLSCGADAHEPQGFLRCW